MTWRIVRGTLDPISHERLAPPVECPLSFDPLGFEPSCSCEVLPSTAEEKDRAVIIPGGVSTGRRASCDCLVVRVHTEGGATWKAAVYGSHQFDGYVEGVFGTPCRDSLLVVTGGFSFLIPADRPGDHERVAGYTTGLVAVPALGVLALADHDKLLGFGPKGPAWETRQLSMCCLRLKTLEEGVLFGDAEDTSSREVPFTVDLRSGTHTGGWGLTLRSSTAGS